MEAQLLLNLMSTGILRIPRQYCMLMQLKIVCYEDRLELNLHPTMTDKSKIPQCGQQICIRRSFLRGIFSDESLMASSKDFKKDIVRTMRVVATYVKAENLYRLVLQRVPETYLRYRTSSSYQKDLAVAKANGAQV